MIHVTSRGALTSREMAFSMRGLPAQFTDIFTQLAAGQSPMQVFIQQGGQLKDMFGGVGAAARALGGYVLGLINPFTVAAAATGLLAAAWFKGSGEQSAYGRALVLTGQAAGVTAGQLGEMAAAIGRVGVGTQGRAAEVLTQNILSSRGRTIRPKTLNQKRYVDAIDQHTVVFGIGPAGTGKTYLAVAMAAARVRISETGKSRA